MGEGRELHPNFGKSPSAETRAKSRVTQGTAIFVYSEDGVLVNSFDSAREAGEFYNCSHTTIVRYLKNGKLFQGKWIFFYILY